MSEASRQASVTAARRRLLICAAVLTGLTLLSALWALSPLRELIEPRAWLTLLRSLSHHPAAPWVAMAGFLLGSLLVLPVTVMVVLTIASFGPTEGSLYAFGGAVLAGLVSFAIGRCLGRRQLDRLAGSRLHGLSLKLRSAGIMTVAAVRMFPLTHFTVVSLAAGVSHIRVRDFLAGTLLGMAPGIGVIAIFYEQMAVALRDPGIEPLLWLAALSLATLSALWCLRRLIRRP